MVTSINILIKNNGNFNWYGNSIKWWLEEKVFLKECTFKQWKF